MKRNQKNEKKDFNSLLIRCILTGFVGGILLGGFWMFMYYFNFSEITPKAYILRSWITAEWTNGWWGISATIFLMGIISIIIAMIYYFTLKRLNSVWIGVLYGVILWLAFFYLLHPLFPRLQELVNFKKDTIISTICLFILYGTFIGYSISYDYYDTHIKSTRYG